MQTYKHNILGKDMESEDTVWLAVVVVSFEEVDAHDKEEYVKTSKTHSQSE